MKKTPKKVGRWTVLGFSHHNQHGHPLLFCVCECGKKRVVLKSSISHKTSLSCGCLQKEMLSNRAIHGHNRRGKTTSEFSTWRNIIQRCHNPKNPYFSYYGGRGISVCARWRRSFGLFLLDMGRKPNPLLTIERVDNDGNYEKVNCKWATRSEQMLNRRAARL